MDPAHAARVAQALSAFVEVRDAWCPRHGRVRPELFTFPFTCDPAVLLEAPPQCGARGCEEGIEVDAGVADVPGSTHMVIHVDGPGGHLPEVRRVAFDLRPQPDGRMATGRAVVQDRPSGVAPRGTDIE